MIFEDLQSLKDKLNIFSIFYVRSFDGFVKIFQFLFWDVQTEDL